MAKPTVKCGCGLTFTGSTIEEAFYDWRDHWLSKRPILNERKPITMAQAMEYDKKHKHTEVPV